MEVGEMIMQLHQEHGVVFYSEVGVASLSGGRDDAFSVKQVSLTDGRTIDADVVVVGVGMSSTTIGYRILL